MRGTWDDVNRRLVSAFLALDLDDVLTVGEREQVQKRQPGRMGRRPPSPPRRFVRVTGSLGGSRPREAKMEASLRRQGREDPWSPARPYFQRETSILVIPRSAAAVVEALRTLELEVEDLQVEFSRDEPEAWGRARGRASAVARHRVRPVVRPELGQLVVGEVEVDRGDGVVEVVVLGDADDR